MDIIAHGRITRDTTSVPGAGNPNVGGIGGPLPAESTVDMHVPSPKCQANGVRIPVERCKRTCRSSFSTAARSSLISLASRSTARRCRCKSRRADTVPEGGAAVETAWFASVPLADSCCCRSCSVCLSTSSNLISSDVLRLLSSAFSASRRATSDSCLPWKNKRSE